MLCLLILYQCIPVQSFGKRHLEDVAPEVNTLESVANWCSVDTRTGRLACVLEENFCFDAEAYADELILDNAAEFHTDQRSELLPLLFISHIPRRKLTMSSSKPWEMDSALSLR